MYYKGGPSLNINLFSKMGAHLSKTSTYAVKWGPISQKHQLMYYKGSPSLNINLCSKMGAHLSKNVNLYSKMGAHLSKASTYVLERGPISQHQLM